MSLNLDDLDLHALTDQVRAIADPFERHQAAAELERRLRQPAETAAKIRKAALVQLYEQEARNMAAVARRLRISRNRVRELLVAAGHLEPRSNGRRKPAPRDDGSTP